MTKTYIPGEDFGTLNYYNV